MMFGLFFAMVAPALLITGVIFLAAWLVADLRNGGLDAVPDEDLN